MLSSPNMTSESSLGLRKVIIEKMKRKENKNVKKNDVTFPCFPYYNKMYDV